MSTVVRFWRSEAGATAIEYCMIGTVVSLSIVVGATGIGGKLKSILANVIAGFN